MPDNKTPITVPINWIHYNGDAHNATGSVAGNAAFTIEEVLPGAYRLKVALPSATYGGSRTGESFHPSMEEAKETAQPYAAAFFVRFADAVTRHPAIAYIGKVARFDFPAQLCHEDCAFYGGDVPHDDIVVERHDGGWSIANTRNGWLYVNPSQEWAEPTEVLSDPGSARFLWPLEEALEQAHFMHCG